MASCIRFIGPYSTLSRWRAAVAHATGKEGGILSHVEAGNYAGLFSFIVYLTTDDIELILPVPYGVWFDVQPQGECCA